MEQYNCLLEVKQEMAGSTIDHLISVTVFMGALLIFISLFNQTLQTAILYQRHRYLATKCSDLLDNILLNPGIPSDWGKSNVTPVGFGLQDPEFTQYRLSPFSLMRLLSSAGNRVYYEKTEKWYSNVSWGMGGGYFLLQEGDCINYSTASKLLGVNGTYGFRLEITPTVTVSINEIPSSNLKLEIKVQGQGSPFTDATINYLIFWVEAAKEEGEVFNGTTKTNKLGLAYLNFNGTSGLPQIDVSRNQTAYTFIAKASLGGLYGVGYKSRDIITKAGNIIPFIENYENGTILLAHKWGKNDPEGSQAALFFNAAFYVLPDNFKPIKIDIVKDKDFVNYGKGRPYYVAQIPTSQAGFLIVTYWTGSEYGMVVMSWGIGAIGMSVVFGGDPIGQEWVATDIRQVIVNGIAYQAKLALWSLEGYGVVG
jgi:hypothetical protein